MEYYVKKLDPEFLLHLLYYARLLYFLDPSLHNLITIVESSF